MNAGSVLVVAAHPDDEVLGMGATSAGHAASGRAVHVLIVGEGATSRGAGEGGCAGRDAVESLRRAARRAAVVLGTRPPEFASLPDNRLDTVPLLDIVKRIEETVSRVAPASVYTHHGGDLNVDHRIVHDSVLTACRPVPGSPVRAVYAFETPSSSEWASPATPAFRPTRFTDVAGRWDMKRKALACYGQEMRDFPHPRSFEAVAALARMRGASVGLEAAEAFEVIREIVR